MPTYDYLCRECGEKFEHFQSMSSSPLNKRPNCKVKNCKVERIISGGTGLIFKGSGYYLTDYKNKKTQSSENKKSNKKKKDNKSKKKVES